MKSFADANSVLSGFVPTDSAEEPKNHNSSFRFILSFCLASCLAVGLHEISAQEIASDSGSLIEDGFTSLCSDVPFRGWEYAGNWVIEDGAFDRAKAGGRIAFLLHGSVQGRNTTSGPVEHGTHRLSGHIDSELG